MSDAALPAISVVVPVLNEDRHVRALLDNLAEQIESGDEIIVVDGGSTDRTNTIVSEFGDPVRSIVEPGSNISRARNIGVQSARNDVIACTDAGCAPAPGWLSALRRCIASTSRPQLATGIYEVEARSPFERAIALSCYPDPDDVEPSGWGALYGRLFGRTFDANWPTGRSVAFTKDAWAAAGGFREDLATAEDVTFGRAIGHAGLPAALCPDARVVWQQRPTAMSTARMYFGYGIGGGRSGDAAVIGRDLIRAAAYAAGIWGLVKGSATLRAALGGAAAVYLSVPVRRALRPPRRDAVAAALVPLALATKDLSKAAGCLAGLLGYVGKASGSLQADVVDDEGSPASDGSFDTQR